jgi:superfamily II DNA or RNA helicase
MADFQIVIDNTWTYLRPNIEVNSSLIRRLESEMSYTVEEYSRFRKTTVELDVSMFEREQLRYPTGLYSVIDRILTECGYTFDVIDGREIPTINQPLQLHAKKLRDYQEEVVEAALKAQRGVIKVATGGGKTVIAAAIVAKLNAKTLFIVYSIDLLEQTADEFESMFHLKVGKIGGGYCDIKQINICTIQTLHCAFDLKYTAVDEESKINEKISKEIFERKEEIRKTVQEAELVICDECHRQTAPIYIQMMKLMTGAYNRFSLCLHKNTKVLLADGRKCSIKSLYDCNKKRIINVMTYNIKKKILEPKLALIIRVSAKNKKLLKLVFRNEMGEIFEIICSSKHRFYVNEKEFKEANKLEIGEKFNTVEKVRKYCLCGKEVLPPHIYCSTKCANSDFKKISEIRKKTIRKMKIEEPEKYKRVYGSGNNFSNPEQISKRLNKYWSTKTKEEKLKNITPMIISGLMAQERLKREGVKKYAKHVKALDGHICESKGEMNVDNWLFKNNIKHEIHSNIPGTLCFCDFKVEHERKVFYIEYDGMNRIPYYKDKIYQDLNLSYLVLRRPDIANDFQLKQKLSFLLFEDPIATLISKTEIENNENYLYDLSILDVEEENQNFFANNVLVHNSATPYRDSSIDRVLDAYSGKQICNISASFLIERKYLVAPKIYMLDPNEHSTYKFIKKSFRNIYEKWIVNNDDRNSMIVDSTQRLLDMQKSVLITVTRIPHGETLCEMLDKAGVKSIAFIRGEVDKIKRKELLNQIREKKLQVLIGSSVADEGVDIPALGSAIMAGGGKSLIKSLQRVGRTLRPYPSAENNEKKEAIIVDFYDRLRYLTGHSKKRIKIYESEPKFQVFKHF